MRLLKWITLLTAAALPALSASAWRSPHPLEWESSSCPLIPFPKQIIGGSPAARDALIKEMAERPSGEALEALSTSLTLVNGLEITEMPESLKGKAWVDAARRSLEESIRRRTEGNDKTLACALELDAEALPPEARAEGYRLHSVDHRVRITAATEAGLFYGLQTLRQLLHCTICLDGKRSLVLMNWDILDYPAFAMRGFHQDCGRNFQTIESLKRQIDLASQLKLNYFHWHFTDYPAYHLECRKYPQLNAPEHRTRDKEDTYTYDQVRELIAYAKERHITIIPEIDMPGHSDYFVRAFGFEMYTEQGMKVLEDVMDEFCAEVSAEDCPIFHIGADEVRVPNAKEFVARMSRKLMEHGRTPMQWEGPWDLPVGQHSIAQRWVQGKASQAADSIKQPTVDSSIGYSNLMPPALLVRRWFFMRPCGVAKGDDLRLGAIFCTWPDRRVAEKSLIPVQSPQWPGMCAMAERAWVGGSTVEADAYPTDMPAPDTEAGQAFASFEQRMDRIRRTIFEDEPFPYWPEKQRENLLVGPVPQEQVEAVRAKVLAGDLEGLPQRKIWGGSFYFHMSPGAWNLGMLSQVQPGHCLWLITRVEAQQDGVAPFMLGFDAPLRSHQYYSGIPEPGEWSRCGTRIWLNGAEMKNPRTAALKHEDRANLANEPEVPLSNDEIWWTHEPTGFPLRQGGNTVIIEQPYTSRIQNWSASFIPLAE